MSKKDIGSTDDYKPHGSSRSPEVAAVGRPRGRPRSDAASSS